MIINSGNPKENSQGPIDIKIDFIVIRSKVYIFHLLEGKKVSLIIVESNQIMSQKHSISITGKQKL